MLRPAILGIAAVIALAVGYTLTAQDNAPKAAGSSSASCCPSTAATPATAEKPAACPLGAAAALAGNCGDKCDTMLTSMDETLAQIGTAKGSNDTKQMIVALDAAGKQLTTAKAHISACLAAKGKTEAAPAQKAAAASCCPSSKTTTATVE